MSVFVYLSMNRGGCCHLDTEHSFVIIHPLHAWELNLSEGKFDSFHSPEPHRETADGRHTDIPSLLENTHIRREHGVARWRLFHRHGKTEGAGAEPAVLHQRDPLQAQRHVSSHKQSCQTSGMCG